MRKEIKKVPTIRFRGFTEDWEQRKFGDVFTERSEKKHESLPPLTIIQGGGTIRRDKMDRKLIYDRKSLTNYKLVRKNDFIVHLRSFEGGLEKSDIEGIVSPAYHIFYGKNINPEFYYNFFRSSEFIKHKLVPFVYGIRDGRSIDIAGMKTIKIPSPSFEEQEQIGNYFHNLDNLITLHQRKFDELKTAKKYFLQNMFPAKGEKVPRIRFHGFTGDWEQRKLINLLDLLTDYDANGSFADMAQNVTTYDGGGYAWYVRMTDLVNKSALTEMKYVDESSYKFLKKTALHGGELLMAKRGEIGNVYIFKARTKRATLAPNMYLLKLNNKTVPDFMYGFFQADIGKKQLLRLNASTTMGALYKDDVKNIDVLLPKLEEQNKIANFFNQLDNLITLHQHKLDQLKTLKKFMLQNLFI